METMYHNLYIGCGIFAIAMLVVAIVLFFVFRIPSVFLDLTGISAKRAIREIENSAENEGVQESSKRVKRKKEKKIMTPTGRINYKEDDLKASSQALSDNTLQRSYTEKLKANETLVLEEEAVDDNVTQVLEEALESDATQVLEEALDGNATQILNELEGKEADQTAAQSWKKEAVYEEQDAFFIIERTILEIHTEEVIV